MSANLSSLQTSIDAEVPNWQRALANAVRSSRELLCLLNVSPDDLPAVEGAEVGFPVLVPRSYFERMEPENPRDPLLLQVVARRDEQREVPGFEEDGVGDSEARIAPGLLQKYAGRALLIATGACAVHCRYCFRRHYPYSHEPKRLADWRPALEAIAADPSLHEIILSGGDPLMLSDERLGALIGELEAIPHLKRLRIHTRLPIVLPERVTPTLLDRLAETRLRVVFVVHANHARELQTDCAGSIELLAQSGMVVLNQAVLLREINDSVAAQVELCERLIDLGVLPYYLHQLDRVQGTAQFEVAEDDGLRIVRALRKRLPGYAVPRYVREVAGLEYKLPLSDPLD